MRFPTIRFPKITLPLWLVERACWFGLTRRPHFLCVDVDDTPMDDEMVPAILYREVRKSFPKWAHFTCPRCGDHIQVPIAASPKNWKISIDWLRRPTLSPSIWEKSTCGAHFILNRGELLWCKD